MSTVLTFTAELISQNLDDRLREFVLTFYLEDSSISVIEKVVPNSGFPGGRFLNRTKAINPATNAPYEPSDITMHADIFVNGWHFVLKSASEETLKLMEVHSDQFARSDLSAFLLPLLPQLKQRLSDLKVAFQRKDRHKKGRVRKDDLIEILNEFEVKLDEQEIITLFRRFQFADTDLFEYSGFLSLIG